MVIGKPWFLLFSSNYYINPAPKMGSSFNMQNGLFNSLEPEEQSAVSNEVMLGIYTNT